MTTTRRSILAAAPAAALAAAVPAAAAPAIGQQVILPLTSPEPDPLLALIEQYRRELAIYNLGQHNDGDDAVWREPFEILCSDPPAPRTLRGALEAIRVVAEEAEDCGGQDDMTVAVLRAVDRFFAAALAAA